jgi:prevent-host-death family protein
MRTVSIREAKAEFSKLLRRVAAGEEITIANRGVPVALLLPANAGKAPHRQLGIDRGRVKVAADFDAPLSIS